MKPAGSTSQARNWCFTLNHPTEEDMRSIPTLLDQKLTYICYGVEQGSENKTVHLQGYAEFVCPVRLTQCRRYLSRAHWEIRRGTQTQAIKYTQKDGDWHEFGTKKDTGYSKEQHWDIVLDLAKKGDLEEVPARVFIAHYHTLKKIAQDYRLMPQTIDGPLLNEWHHGPTGTGKSYTVRKENPEFYYKMNNKWWDNYADEDVVLIEDLGHSHEWMGDFLKIWADRYPFRAEIKNLSTSLRPKKIIVTSNYLPHQIWQDPNIHEPLERRFKFIQYKSVFVHPMFDAIIEKNKLQSADNDNSEGDTFCPKGHILDEDGYGIVDGCCAKKM